MTLPERIKKIRRDAKLTQSEFGKIVGLGTGSITNIETGRDKPGTPRLFLIAEKFGVNPEWLIEGKGEPYRTQTVDDETRDRIEREHIRKLFSELSPKTQRIVLDVLREELGVDKIETRSVKNNAEVNGDVRGDVIINQE